MTYLFKLRYTLRLLLKTPGTALVAVFILALGLAVAVPIYALVYSFGYGSLPFADEDKIVRFMVSNSETGQPQRIGFDSYQYKSFKESLPGVEVFAAYDGSRAILSDGDVASNFIMSKVTPSFFSIMPARPLLGRTLQASDEEFGAAAAVVLGYSAWQSYYGGNSSIVGEISRINGESHTIVGVMPEGYNYPDVSQLWTALSLNEGSEPGGSANLNVLAKLDTLTDSASVNIALDGFYNRLRTEFADNYPTASASVIPFTQYLALTSNMVPIGYLMSGIVLAILVLVSFNLGNLLLIRTNERIQELGIRNALGSTKTEIIQEVLRESLIICMAGLVAGLILTKIVLGFVANEVSYLLGTEGAFSLPAWIQFELTSDVVLFALAATFLIWITTGMFSSWKLTRQDIGRVVQGGSHSVLGGAGKRLMHVLVGVEITLSTLLLVVCGAFFVATYNGVHADFGSATENLVTGQIELPQANYATSTSRQSYLNDLRAALLDQEGLSDVTFGTAVPGQDGERVTYALDDRVFDSDTPPSQNQVWVATNFFDLFEVPLREGRWFDTTDVVGSQSVAIIDELFAENSWPGESPIGKRIEVTQGETSERLQIVGVTSHIIHDEPMAPQSSYTSLYRPITQSPLDNFRFAAKVEVDLDVNFALVSNKVKLAAAQVDREIPVNNIHPLERIMRSSMNLNDMIGELLLAVAFVVFALAVIALFAIVSRSIVARTSEIGIRRALGSSELKAMSIFLKQGLSHIAFALPIGGGLGILVSASFMEDVNDMGGILTSVSIVVALTIAVMVFLASYIPSRKVVAMEPGEALHYE